LVAAALLTSGAAERVHLAGVGLGAPVTDVVTMDGAPGLVATTDDGIEWRWFDAAGIDVDLLTDDALIVRQVLAARPQPVRGLVAPLVQPSEFPLLEATASAAAKRMASSGAPQLAEPEDAVSAWRVGSDVLVLELMRGRVNKLLALDDVAAVRFGYVAGQTPAQFRAPRLVRQFAVDYPKRALSQHAQGVVVVAVDLSEAGTVSHVRVVVSSGNADIDAAEMLSMRRSTFEPARCAGLACASVYVDREEYSLP
jgi:TonB family protein